MQSNHPNTIKKELPRMTDKMISEHSCNKEKFDKAKGIYEKTINETNFRVILNFNEQQNEKKETEKLYGLIWHMMKERRQILVDNI